MLTTSAILPSEGVEELLSRLDETLPRAERCDTVRKILQQTAKTEDRLQLRMAELLTEVHQHRYFLDWGFRTFKEFVEAECHFGLRKAQLLVEVYQKFAVELRVPADELRRLEWSKAALVARVINSANRDELLHSLKHLPHRELQAKIQEIRKKPAETPPGTSAESVSTPSSPSPPEIARDASSGWRLPRPAEDEFFVSEEVWEQLCYAVNQGENLLLIGPTGCGKSEVCYLLASAAGKRIEPFNLGATTEPRAALIGNTHLDRSGTRFVESRFIRAIRDPNCCVLLDELSRAGRDCFNILLPLLVGQGYMALDEGEDAAIVRRAPGVSFLATANLGMEYTGTEQMDLALKDRFPVTITMDFPPFEQELEIICKRCPGLNKSHARRLLKVAKRERELGRDGDFVGMISTRALLAAGRQIAAGVSPENAFKFCILNRFSNDGGDSSERARLLQIFQKG
jgi:MoxR-like ATPase